MQLRELMTHTVEAIRPETTLREAAEKMRSLDVGALPVRDQDRLVGMITDRDITIRAVAEGRDPNQTRVRDAMTEQVCYCYEDEDVEKAAKLMEERQIRRLPVFDRSHRLCGIVSLGDIATRTHNDRLSGAILEEVSEPAIPHA